MGTDQRVPAGVVIDKLVAEPYRFDFYQAVSLLEQATKHRRPLGHDGHQPEAVRFRSEVSLGFPPSDVVAVEPAMDGHQPTLLTVAVMGLAGAQGPLPIPFTDMVLQRNAARDFATRDLLDIFNHRFLSFLYRSRQKHRVSLARVPPDKSSFADHLRATVGRTLKPRPQNQVDWGRPLLHYAGLMSGAPRSFSALQTLLSDYFGIRVSGEQLVGNWLPVDKAEWTQLGHFNGKRQELGKTALLGTRAWDQRAGIRLRLHGIPQDQIESFLPGGSRFDALNQLTREFLQEAFDVEILLEANRSAAVPLGLNTGARLGWTSWLPSAEGRYEPIRLNLPSAA
jgi:type VI secretion system protein ImpH